MEQKFYRVKRMCWAHGEIRTDILVDIPESAFKYMMTQKQQVPYGYHGYWFKNYPVRWWEYFFPARNPRKYNTTAWGSHNRRSTTQNGWKTPWYKSIMWSIIGILFLWTIDKILDLELQGWIIDVWCIIFK